MTRLLNLKTAMDILKKIEERHSLSHMFGVKEIILKIEVLVL